VSFEVWAPTASKVQLSLDGQLLPMTPSARAGWWESDATGTDYGFVLDDSTDVLPDPRSRWQPNGVHQPSRVYNDNYQWNDSAWAGRELAGGVIYELHIGTFTPEGTLDSAIDRLDYLVDLGIDFVEVLPVNAFNGEHNWGYDGVFWFAVQQSYGGPEAYQRFVDACHARGLAVIQDVVYNHLGPSGNYLPQFGPYLLDASANNWGDSVNLGEPEVRRYILDNALGWMRDYHVDGLRLDAVHALVDPTEEHLLRELSHETAALSAELGRPLTLIAESDLNDPVMITPHPGYGLDAQWSDDYHHAVHVALTGETTGYYADFEPLSALAKVATEGFFHNGTYSSFRERDHGQPIPSDVPTSRLVTFSQDHDQIGNRAIGDRLTESLDYGQLAIAAVLVLAGPYTPMLFMGEEWGASTPWQFFTSHPEKELGEATARGRIAEFEKMGWDPDVVPDPQDPETFTRSKLDWSELSEGDHARLLQLYKDLIALRRERSELRDTSFSSLSAEVDEATGYFRLDRGALSIVVNLGTGDLSLIDGTILLSTSGSGLPPHSAAIIERAAPTA